MRKRPFKSLSVFVLAILLGHVDLSADAGVDGFFREDLVEQGVFEENSTSAQVGDKTPAREVGSKDKFFISREARRMHPDQAPSNRIDVPNGKERIKVRQKTLSLPNISGTGLSAGSVGEGLVDIILEK